MSKRNINILRVIFALSMISMFITIILALNAHQFWTVNSVYVYLVAGEFFAPFIALVVMSSLEARNITNTWSDAYPSMIRKLEEGKEKVNKDAK